MSIKSLTSKITPEQEELLSRLNKIPQFISWLEGFGCAQGDAVSYIKTHYHRYILTRQLISKSGSFRVLELGASYPYAFSLMLKTSFPNSEIYISEYDETKRFDTKKAHNVVLENATTGEEYTFDCRDFNVEKDLWPYEDDFFDVVLCMEILEHLLLDPCFLFKEANRVLRYQGELIVTTPNIASYEGLFNLIQLKSPYRYGVYSKHGAYGRHNREYVPGEIQKIGEACGFDSAVLTTDDVYESNVDFFTIKEVLNDSENISHLRGQTIFYQGIKSEKKFTKYPSELYDYDPDAFSANIELKEISASLRVGEPIKGRIFLKNLSGFTWMNMGNDITRLGVMILDNDRNIIARDFRRVDLPEALAPGQQIDLEFELDGYQEEGRYILRFDLVREYVCWFSEINPCFVDKVIEIF